MAMQALKIAPAMDQLVVCGGRPLHGDVHISGAKNAALPLLTASLLSENPLVLGNVPHLSDVTCMLQLLGELGVSVRMREWQKLELCAADVTADCRTSDTLSKTMRASFLILGPLLARFQRATVFLPGGDEIGARPIDIHLRAFSAMGVAFEMQGDQVFASAKGRLRGSCIDLAYPTVTGTANVMMAATLAAGSTVIRNAAREPEICALASCLNLMGARISGHGSSKIRIEGVDRLDAAEYWTPPDRIETATYLAVAAITGGRVRARQADPSSLRAVLDKFKAAGAGLTVEADSITLDMEARRPRAVDVQTAPYPGFPTDVQAQFMALNCIAEGRSRISENIFENRFQHARELMRMNARITLHDGSTATVEGVPKLSPAEVRATDLRASFSLIMAALTIPGETRIGNCHHIDRGYEFVEEKLGKLGADVRREAIRA